MGNAPLLEFGLALPAGPPKDQLNRFTDALEIVLPKLEAQFSGIWMTDHFLWVDDTTTPKQIVEQRRPLNDAGVTCFQLFVLGLPDQEIIGLLTEEVLPKLRR